MKRDLAAVPETVRGMMALVAIAESIRDAALAGLGIADLPAYFVARDLEQGALVRVLDGFPRVQRSIYVLYAPSPFTPTKVRLFVEALRTAFRGWSTQSLTEYRATRPSKQFCGPAESDRAVDSS
jgi:DNA-binding transcriptional LysR family regulator